MISFAGRYYRTARDEQALTALMVQGWISAFSLEIFPPTTVAGTGWDDDLESATLSNSLAHADNERPPP